MARLRERPSATPGTPSSWRVQWRMGGRTGKDQSCTFPIEKLAAAAKALAESRRHNITDTDVYAAVYGLDQTSGKPQAPTLGEWTQTWIAERREVGDVQDDTLTDYLRIIVRRILPQLGHLHLTDITEDTVKDWVRWLNKQPSRRGGTLSANTVRRAHAVLHGLLGAAIPKWLPANPAGRAAGAKRRSGLPKAVRYDAVFLTPTEINLILTHCGPAIHDLVYVAVRTGLRLGELLVLRVQDVDVTSKRKVIRVRRALKAGGAIGEPKSRRSRRDVPIRENVAVILRALIQGKRRGDLLFTAPRGGMWDPSHLHHRHWMPALAAAQRCPDHMPEAPKKGNTGPARKLRPDEISTCQCATRLHRRPRFHDLRHTYVSLAIASGMPIEVVSRRVGHDSVAFTWDVYGHLRDDGDDDRLDEFERQLMIAEDEAA